MFGQTSVLTVWYEMFLTLDEDEDDDDEEDFEEDDEWED